MMSKERNFAMKIREGQKSIGRMLATGVAMVSFGAQAITTNVSTVAELAGALNYLNEEHSASDTVVLEPGLYALDDLHLQFFHKKDNVWKDGNSHLGLSYFTMRGKTGNPRDVVLYLERPDTNTLSMIYGYVGGVRDLTISNFTAAARSACANANNNSTYSNVVVTTCSAQQGAAANNGLWQDCWFENCSATTYGGAIGGAANLVGCTVTNCTCGNQGGGVFKAVMTDCTIADCSSEAVGGGAYQAVLTGCTIRNCTSPLGGGAHLGALTNCWIEGCSADNGGGVSKATLYDCVVTNNTATTAGGGLHAVNGSYTAEKCRIVGNTAGRMGGGANESSLTDCLVAGNSARLYGGGVSGKDSNSLASYVQTDCVISNNTIGGTFTSEDKLAPGGAGATFVTLNGGRVTMNLTAIDTTEKNLYAYGGLYTCTATDVMIDGNAVTGTCKNVQGGGAANSTLLRCEILNNISSTFGGGVCSGKATACVISNNASLNASAAVCGAKLDGCMIYGGSIDPQESVLNTVIRGYTNGNVIARGTSVLARDADLHIEGSTHLVTGWGGFTNCLFVGQDMTTSYSALFGASRDNETILSSCTIADNRVPYTHAGFTDASKAKFTAVNCIFSDNYTDGGVASDLRSSYTNLQFTSCLIKKVLSFRTLEELRYDCPGCITGKSAKFGRIEETPYIVRSSSPAVGNGLYQDWMASATDIRRDPAFPRSVDGKVDMGCYQGCVPGPGFMLLFR